MFLFRDDSDTPTVHKVVPALPPEAPVGPPMVYKNPTPCVDVIVPNVHGQVALIKRKNPPHGWALPGGFIDEGETAEQAAIREVKEELGIDIELHGLLGVYSDPKRDPRKHILSVVYVAEIPGTDVLKAGDDAADASWVYIGDHTSDLAFDHAKILQDFVLWRDANAPEMQDLRKTVLSQLANGHHTWQAYMDEEPTAEDIAGCIRRIARLAKDNHIAKSIANGKTYLDINYSVGALRRVIDILGLHDQLEAEPASSTTSRLVFR